ncbi:MAG: dTDP-4-dehydrorhamnose reductase [Candidatus Marinimicrobia bacterium]|nr:dTDP-4-dehydrorhamnose reductase [Candidatus Neomarinimicrobiota bacterium]
MEKRLMITGINGLLSQNLVQEFSQEYRIHGIDLNPGIYPENQRISVAQLDLTKTDELKHHIHKIKPHVLIHTAAYTNVDRAEEEPETAFAINAKVPAVLADLCLELDIPLVHISTDYVFDGQSGPYDESAPCNPQGIYAESKYAGEKAVLESGAKVAVIRPNVMYGRGVQLKSSFVDWLVKELGQNRSVNIVDDQYNNPTYASRLAKVIRIILGRKAWDVWHFGSKEIVSRYDFALKVADIFGLSSELIYAISTVDLNQRAPRPMRSGLICEKVKRELGINILSIDEELALLKEEMDVA